MHILYLSPPSPEIDNGDTWLDSGDLQLPPGTTVVVFSATKGADTGGGFGIEGDIAIDNVRISGMGGPRPPGPEPPGPQPPGPQTTVRPGPGPGPEPTIGPGPGPGPGPEPRPPGTYMYTVEPEITILTAGGEFMSMLKV